jgi:hypothetical protein
VAAAAPSAVLLWVAAAGLSEGLSWALAAAVPTAVVEGMAPKRMVAEWEAADRLAE